MKKLIGRPWLLNTIPLVIWFLLLVMPFLSKPENMPAELHRHFFISVFTSNAILLIIFYLHTYFIYPQLQKSVPRYILLLVAVVSVYAAVWLTVSPGPRHGEGSWRQATDSLNNVTEHPHRHHRREERFNAGGERHFNIMPVMTLITALLCSFFYRRLLDDAASEERLRERETIHLKTELNFLRSQISPHFLFNVLNSLVSLSRKKSEKIEPALINLSQLMRYMLYESDDNRVPLKQEIDYLKGYINLQLLRFGDEVKVSLSTNGNFENFSIEPMLLIPFVENAFKHGTGMVDSPMISVRLEIDEATRTLNFKVLNLVSGLDSSKDKDSGIGLVNVRRRLDILYPGRHTLEIHSRPETFTVELSIIL